jgi:hypothetical protein
MDALLRRHLPAAGLEQGGAAEGGEPVEGGAEPAEEGGGN